MPIEDADASDVYDALGAVMFSLAATMPPGLIDALRANLLVCARARADAGHTTASMLIAKLAAGMATVPRPPSN